MGGGQNQFRPHLITSRFVVVYREGEAHIAYPFLTNVRRSHASSYTPCMFQVSQCGSKYTFEFNRSMAAYILLAVATAVIFGGVLKIFNNHNTCSDRRPTIFPAHRRLRS